jgi:hypothetical protein
MCIVCAVENIANTNTLTYKFAKDGAIHKPSTPLIWLCVCGGKTKLTVSAIHKGNAVCNTCKIVFDA